ncbi:MAG: hypothetical protein IJ073_05750 [Lachnospiraceae bacterium]|nr:hypothetical protein [Lachnospiraceae bacterium]
MPSNEKELNMMLFDQLTIVDRLDRAQKDGKFDEERDRIKEEINRKLYQQPPLTSE